MENILMMAYAAIIPIVPLAGFDIFRKRGDFSKQMICLLLFVMQLFISGAAVYQRFFA